MQSDNNRTYERASTQACGVSLITTGITCFNAESTIRRAVLSAIKQDWPNNEIIVVDDCSTDTSWQILKSLAERYPIRLIRHDKNRGVASARNTLIEMAQGEFIAYFDDDDESYPHRLTAQWKRIVEYERRHNCTHVLCTAVRNVAKNDKIDHRGTALGQHAPEPHGRMVADYFLGLDQREGIAWGLFGTCVLMARVSVLRELGGFDRDFRRRAEWDLAIRAAFRGAHFIAVDEPLITQYKTAGFDKSESIYLEYALRLIEKHRVYLAQRWFYRASRAMARSNFHGRKGDSWKSGAYALLAYALSPAFVWHRVTSKLSSWSSAGGE